MAAFPPEKERLLEDEGKVHNGPVPDDGAEVRDDGVDGGVAGAGDGAVLSVLVREGRGMRVGRGGRGSHHDDDAEEGVDEAWELGGERAEELH